MKNYILDTNVLLHDPNSLLNFEDNDVLIPIEVIEEIDQFKRESTERGKNARTVSRSLDDIRQRGRLSEGVKLDNGGRLKIIFRDENGHTPKANGNGKFSVDSKIVALALQVQKDSPKRKTILITKDINLRLKADALGLMAQDYETDRVFLTELYSGMFELSLRCEPE